MANANYFARSLIERNISIELGQFMEQAIANTMANELSEAKFVNALNLYKSFEGINDTFCINLQGAWLKYALNNIHDNDALKSGKLIRDILGKDYSEKEITGDIPCNLDKSENDQKEMRGDIPPHLQNSENSILKLSDEMYRQINWLNTDNLAESIEDSSSERKYILMKCKKQRGNNAWHDINMIILRPRDLIDLFTSSKCIKEYRTYFIGISDIYRSYQETYTPWLINHYRSTNAYLVNDNKSLNQKLDALSQDNKTLVHKVDQLLGHAKETHVKLDETKIELKQTNAKLDESHVKIDILTKKVDTLFEFNIAFSRMTLTMWIGSHVIKSQLVSLKKENTKEFAMNHLKLMFVVSFIEYYAEPTEIVRGDTTTTVHSKITMYFCCTNFANVSKRLNVLKNKHANLYMLRPKAVCLISCEVNLERAAINQLKIFPENSIVGYSSKTKAYEIELLECNYTDISKIYSGIINRSRSARFQMYQSRMDEYRNSSSIKPEILNSISETDAMFYNSTLPYCQSYLNCYTEKLYDDNDNFIEWGYTGAKSRKLKARSDLEDARLSDRDYQICKLCKTIDDHDANDPIDEMVRSNIINKDDIESLKLVAKVENVDITNVEFPNTAE